MLIYVAGPYSGDIDANIQEARQVACRLWEAGHAVICPHLNTAHFERDCKVGYDDYIRGDLNIISRCDALVLLPAWKESKGAVIEQEYASSLEMPIYYWPCEVPLHLTEQRSPVQVQAFREQMGQMYRLHLDKNQDYSPLNVVAPGELGVVVRLWDKICRLMNLSGFRVIFVPPTTPWYERIFIYLGLWKKPFVITGINYVTPLVPKHESIDDTLDDTAVYAVIGRLQRQHKWGR